MVLALLGGLVWWGSVPYAPFTDTTHTLRLFEVVPPHPPRSQVLLVLALAFAIWRFRGRLLPRLRTWAQTRGGALRGDMIAVLLLLATAGFYPRARATGKMFWAGMAEYPNDILTWLGLAALVAGFAIVSVACAPKVLDRLANLWKRLETLPVRTFVCGAVLLAIASATLVSVELFNGLPIASDGANYRFQANMFAHRHLTLPTPPEPGRFTFVSTLLEPRWRSIVNPGWPLLLVLGIRAGAPWLINPLCHGATVGLLYALGARWWSDRTGRVAALLGLLSPFLVLPAGTHMSHTSALFALLLFLWLWQRMMDRNSAAWAVAAGLVLGWAATIRPLDAAALAFPWGVWTVVQLARRRLRVAPVLALGVGVALPLAGLGWYNAAVHGSPTTFGYDLYYEGKLKLGFGSAPDLTYTRHPHTPARGVMNATNNLNALNKILLGWPVPALALIGVALRTRARTVLDTLCAAGAGTILAVYFLFVHADFMFGARYYHAAAGVLLCLAARGTVAVAQVMGPRVAAATIVPCLLFGAACFYPNAAYFYRPEAPVFQGVQTRLHEALAQHPLHHALVCIDAGSSLAYGGGIWRNADGAASDVVFALDDSHRNAALRAAFPDRAAYRYQPDRLPPRLEPLRD